MPWGQPEYQSHEYNAAGKVLSKGDTPELSMDSALDIINNWRSSHYHPLNTFQKRLRKKAQAVDSNSLVAQRIKRLFSIKHKLERFPSMRLTQIQDIGGCRAIVSTIDHLDKLVDIMSSKDESRSSRGVKHKLIDHADYIKNPKLSGYRGVHLVFKYHSDKVHTYDGLKIEIQFRTLLQHAWATAVETVGIFIGQALKSSIGQEDWLKFFVLASSAMANYEGTPLVPGAVLTPDELRSQLRVLTKELDVVAHLQAYRVAMTHLEGDNKNTQEAHYYLLELDAEQKSVSVTSYKQSQFEAAATDYLKMERSIKEKNIDAVLVSADSIASLKKAYPNYFTDTEVFLEYLKKIIA